MKWTADFVINHAPDTPSVSAALNQAVAKKWTSLHRDDEACWGEVKGSSTKPYLTHILFDHPTFHCTCPSRKTPCKHALGLGLIFAKNSKLFQASQPPDWVRNTIDRPPFKNTGSALSDQSESSEESTDSGQDDTLQKRLDARAKRRQKRIDKVSDGLDDLSARLEELLRIGLGSIEDPSDYWEHIARRLVDAQATALARSVQELPSRASTPQLILREIGRLYLICCVWKRRHLLTEEERADIMSMIGFNVSQDELSRSDGIKDTWLLVASQTESSLNLSMLTQWFWGSESGRLFHLTSYAAYRQPHPITFQMGHQLIATACRYPGTNTQRVIFKDLQPLNEQDHNLTPQHIQGKENARQGMISIDELSSVYAESRSINPWVDLRGYLIKDFQVCRAQNRWWGLSKRGERFSLNESDFLVWRFLSLSRGQPSQVFATWNGEQLSVHTLITQQSVISVSRVIS